LVFDLKRSLRDQENQDDARALLKKLRMRRDLFATIAEEIDEVLGSIRKVATTPVRASEVTLLPSKRPPKKDTLLILAEN
jgi:hypothetical protein